MELLLWTVQALGDGPLLCQGQMVRGHEFHWPVPKDMPNRARAYRIIDKWGRREGFHKGNLLASYIHLHPGSLPSMALRFIENCHWYQYSQEAS